MASHNVRLIWQPVASFALQKQFLGRLHQAALQFITTLKYIMKESPYKIRIIGIYWEVFPRFTLCCCRAQPDWAYEFPDWTEPDTQIFRTGPAGQD